MDLENLKNTWKEEEISAPEISLETQNEIHNPLQKIRKNMRMEFWTTVIMLVPMMFLLYFYIESLKVKVYSFTLVFVMLLVIAFYFKKFFLLYNELSKVALNTKDSLKDLLHQFELNKQYYYSYYLAFAPFLVCEMVLIAEFRNLKTPLHNEPQHIQELAFALLFVVSTICGLFFLYSIGKWWFQQYYGKYIDNIVVLNNQINGGYHQELQRIEKRKNKLYSKTDRFLSSKLGKAGNYLNTVLWLFIFVIAFFIILFVGGVIVGFMISHFQK